MRNNPTGVDFSYMQIIITIALIIIGVLLFEFIIFAHEFGHFVDGYVNNGSDVSLDLSEVSSQALEYLTLLALEEQLSESSYKYLEYEYLTLAMESLINQGIIGKNGNRQINNVSSSINIT